MNAYRIDIRHWDTQAATEFNNLRRFINAVADIDRSSTQRFWDARRVK